MDKLRFIEILKNPTSLTPSDFEALEEVLRHYPYMQAAHLLKAKYLFDKGSMHAEKSLRSAAIFANDRVLLKQLIYGAPASYVKSPKPDFETEPIPVPENNLIIESTAEVVANEVIAADSSQQIQQPEFVEIVESVQETPIVEETENTIAEIETEPEEQLNTATVTTEDTPARLVENTVVIQEPVAPVLSVLSKELIKEWKKEIAGIEDKSAVKVTRADTAALKTIANLPQIEIPALREEITDFISLDVEEDFTKTLAGQETKDFTPVAMSESELGDELVNTDQQEGSGTAIEADVLIDYLHYLENRSKEKPRSNLDFDYIERFIREEPRISRIEPRLFDYSKNKNWANESEAEDTEIISENLAIIMVRQNKLKRAIDIYHKLILKYPEKKDYFVQKIEDLEKN